MRIRTILIIFFTILVAELAALGTIIALITTGQQELADSENLQYRAFRTADELRQSSDDLTRMARTFASTGDPAFEQYFRNILDIRDGKIPRPANYQSVYWDFVAVGQELPGEPTAAISLDAQLEALNLTPEEVELLAEAKANSDALVSLEDKALNAVKGIFTENGETVQRPPDLAMARALLFGADYHAAKAEIMRPINEFLVAIEQRMNAAVAEQRVALNQLEFYAALAVAMCLLTFLALALIVRRRMLSPINLMVEKTEAIRKGSYGDQVDVKSEDEIGVLAGALNRMSTAIASDVARRTESEADLRHAKDEAEQAVAELQQTQEHLIRHEAELNKNQDIFQGLADSLPEFVSLKDPDGRYIFVNRKYEEWSGTKRAQVIGKTLFEIYDAEQAEAIHARDQLVVDSREPHTDESTRTYPDGVTRTVLRTRVPVNSRQGDFLGVATVNHDITERRMAEEKLLKSERRLSTILEGSPIGISISAKVAGESVFTNATMIEQFGMTKEQYIASPVEERYVNKQDLKQIFELLERDGRVVGFESLKKRQDGSEFWGRVSIVPFEHEDEAGWIAFQDDVTDRKMAEEEVRRSEARFRAVIDNSPSEIVIKDTDLKYVRVNRIFEEHYGVSNDEIVGKSAADFLPESMVAPVNEQDRQVMATGVESEAELETVVDGKSRFNLESKFPIRTDGGVVIGIAGIAADITDRKKSEDELNRQRRITRDVLENITQGIVKWGADHRLVFANRHYEETMQLPDGSIDIGKDARNIAEFLAKRGDFGEGNPKKLADAWIASLFDGEFQQSELTIDGDATYLSVVQPTDDGGVIITYTDITQRKAQEEQLASNEARMRDVLDSSPAGISVTAFEGLKRIYCNSRFNEMFTGNPETSLDGTSVNDSHVDAEELQKLVKTLVSKNYHHEAEIERRRTDGSRFWCLHSWHPVNLWGADAYMCWHYDITERREAEEELRGAKQKAEDALSELKQTQARLVTTEKMASLGQLTAGIAHEIKNPLNFVNNFSETSVELLGELKEVIEPVQEHLDEDDRDDVVDIFETLTGDLQKIHHHGSRADGIVKSMLLHARGDSTEQVSTDINGLVDDALQLAYHGERARDKSFQVTLDQQYGDDVGKVEIVPQDITRVLVNLLSNAFYAVKKRTTDEKSESYVPTVSVVTSDSDGSVEIKVRDNGTGMPEEVRKKLFEPFFTTKPTGEGTGLGLSMCFDIVVQQHGGNIAVDSEPGAYTEFVVTLPRDTKSDPVEIGSGGAS